MPEFIKPFGKIPDTVAPFVSVDVTSAADCGFKQAIVELRTVVALRLQRRRNDYTPGPVDIPRPAVLDESVQRIGRLAAR
jgi:hypothetical protein